MVYVISDFSRKIFNVSVEFTDFHEIINITLQYLRGKITYSCTEGSTRSLFRLLERKDRKGIEGSTLIRQDTTDETFFIFKRRKGNLLSKTLVNVLTSSFDSQK